jgi:serine protease
MTASVPRFARLGALLSAAAIAASLLVAAIVVGVAGAGAPRPGDLTSSDQVVVRWVDGSAGTAFGATADGPSVGARPDRVAAVSEATGRPTTWLRTLSVGGDVYRLDRMLGPAEMGAAMVDLRGTPGVVYAEPDLIANADATPPNDPCWNGSAPCADAIGQWDLREGTTATTYGIDLLGAWDRTLGSGVRVAVLDTGITTHPDLAGQTVAGYDFIASTSLSADGNGRDPDPSDPGDWYTDFSGPHASSWHGTHVTGTIVAVAGNATGIAGIAPQAKVQPLRVLGTGGSGYFSDITDALVWGSGGSVAGVPTNPTPARVESLSLGGAGTCPTSTQAAINAAIARGTAIVVAAGNDGRDASSYVPANCAGVITVAATTRTGVRASFSNYGSAVEISAPGVSLWSTLNSGTQGPVAPSYARYSGTSMATPHVSAVAALMFAVKPTLTPTQVTSLMQQTAHPFGAGGCPPGCGSGIVDAARAVAAAAGATPTPTPTPTPGPSATPTPSPTASPAPTATPVPGCVRGTPTLTASPTSVALFRGSSAIVTLTLRNADPAACGSSTFTWTVVANPVVSGFTSSTPASVSVAPGASQAVTATISALATVPSGTRVGFTYRATRTASPTTAAGTVTAVKY